MRGRDLAGRAGRAGRHRDPVEIERDQRGLGLDARAPRTSVVLGSRAASAPKMIASGVIGAQAALRAGRAGAAMSAASAARSPQPPQPPRRSRRCRRHSRCRRARRAPARRRGSAGRRCATLSSRRTSAPTPLRAADLVRRQRQKIGAERLDIAAASARPPAPHRHAAGRPRRARARPPRRPAGSRRSRCWRASARPATGAPARSQAAAPAPRDRSRRRGRPASFSTASGRKRPPASTDGCSIAETSSASKRRRVAADLQRGVSASTFASVPPEVKITLRGSAPTSAATCSRASSISARAARPSRMDRRRVADQRPAPRTMAARACGPQRRGRIPVEIDARRH